ncbi:MAG: hypothetical protein ISR95_03545 [Candidatus Marinimicrobia bacterium]|nr:hypothetical protein [Candidatus Neomarinimicrobiota bacterium]
MLPLEKTLLEKVLAPFQIDIEHFRDCISVLEKSELIEVSYEYAKIPEQNIALYFFYRAVVQDSLISLPILFDNFYARNRDRFRDCIIPVTNIFGGSNITDKIEPIVKKYFQSLEHGSDISIELLDDFWFILLDECLDYIQKSIVNLKITTTIEFTPQEKSDFNINEMGKPLSLIRKFIRSNYEMGTVLELAFEYVQKDPSRLPYLHYIIKEDLSIKGDDFRSGFTTQLTFLEKLRTGIESGEHLFSLFFLESANYFLKFVVEYHEYNSRTSAIIISRTRLPNEPSIHRLRENIWLLVETLWDTNGQRCLQILEQYLQNELNEDIDLLNFDTKYINTLIKSNFNPDSFEHCKFLYDLRRYYRRIKYFDAEIENLQEQFSNKTFNLYLKLRWDILGDRGKYEDYNFDEFNSQKKAELLSSFKLETEDGVEKFYSECLALSNLTPTQNYHKSISVVVQGLMNAKPALGFYWLTIMIKNGNNLKLFPESYFFEGVNSRREFGKIWSLINSGEYEKKIYW